MSWLKVFTSRRLFEVPSSYCVAARMRGVVRGVGGAAGCSVSQAPKKHDGLKVSAFKTNFTKQRQFSLSQSFGSPAGGSVAVTVPAASPTESQINRQTRCPPSLPAASKKNFYSWKFFSRRLNVLKLYFQHSFSTQ